MDEMAEFRPHAAHRTMEVLAGNGSVVVWQLPKSLNIVRVYKIGILHKLLLRHGRESSCLGLGRQEHALLLQLLISYNFFNLLNIEVSGSLHKLAKCLLT